MALQIRKWKNELLEEMEKKDGLSATVSCNHALFDVCLKHVSCRQLWNIFRNACAVDSSNQCKMSDKETCWQSFEGIYWTGLGNCSCNDRNSDCHWIRLQTRYNKCIYELHASGEHPSITSFLTSNRVPIPDEPIPERYQMSSDHFEPQSEDRGDAATHPGDRNHFGEQFEQSNSKLIGISTMFTPQEEYEIDADATANQHRKMSLSSSAPITEAKAEAENKFTQTDVTWSNDHRAHFEQKSAQMMQNDEWKVEETIQKSPQNKTDRITLSSSIVVAPFEGKETGRDSLHRHSESDSNRLESSAMPHLAAPQTVESSDHYRLSTIIQSDTQFAQKHSSISTCISASNRCNRFDTCKWHLSEVQIRCAQPCNRQLCAQAIQRFARYVPRPAVESLMFCHCDATDIDCLAHERQLYPPCLYTHAEVGQLTCTNAVEKCRQDYQCQHYSSALFNYCAVRNGMCTISELDHCRHALIAVRGTYLEYPCYCHSDDAVCRRYQSGMLPNNPCIEKAMLEYSNMMSDNDANTNGIPSTQAVVTGSRESSLWKVNGENEEEAIIADDRKPLLKLDESSKLAAAAAQVENRNKAIEMDDVDESISRETPNGLADKLNDQTRLQSIDHQLGERFEKTTVISDGDHLIANDHNQLSTTEKPQLTMQQRQQQQEQQILAQSANPMNDASKQPAISGSVRVSSKHRKLKPKTNQSPVVDWRLKTKNAENVANHSKVRSSKSEARSVQKPRQKPHHQQPHQQHQHTVSSSVDDATAHQTRNWSSPRIRGSMYSGSGEEIRRKDENWTRIVPATISSKQKASRNFTQHHATVPMPFRAAATGLPQLADDGCTTKDANGNAITHSKRSIFKRFHDWTGRCSSWCTCDESKQMSCMKLPCLRDGDCKAPLTKIEYGERLYMKDRGACTCMTGAFVCERPERMPELNLGLYLLIGYSADEISVIKQSVPKAELERSGFLSDDEFVAHDIGGRLQLALERVMPVDLQCRLTSFDDFKDKGNMIYQLEWFGVNYHINETTKRWHTGQAEKVCSPYVNRLADAMMRGEAVRYELVLSTVKQIKVLDLLDKLPDASARTLPTTTIFAIAIPLIKLLV